MADILTPLPHPGAHEPGDYDNVVTALSFQAHPCPHVRHATIAPSQATGQL